MNAVVAGPHAGGHVGAVGDRPAIPVRVVDDVGLGHRGSRPDQVADIGERLVHGRLVALDLQLGVPAAQERGHLARAAGVGLHVVDDRGTLRDPQALRPRRRVIGGRGALSGGLRPGDGGIPECLHAGCLQARVEREVAPALSLRRAGPGRGQVGLRAGPVDPAYVYPDRAVRGGQPAIQRGLRRRGTGVEAGALEHSLRRGHRDSGGRDQRGQRDGSGRRADPDRGLNPAGERPVAAVRQAYLGAGGRKDVDDRVGDGGVRIGPGRPPADDRGPARLPEIGALRIRRQDLDRLGLAVQPGRACRVGPGRAEIHRVHVQPRAGGRIAGQIQHRPGRGNVQAHSVEGHVAPGSGRSRECGARQPDYYAAYDSCQYKRISSKSHTVSVSCGPGE
jgi:hypothetical protein